MRDPPRHLRVRSIVLTTAILASLGVLGVFLPLAIDAIATPANAAMKQTVDADPRLRAPELPQAVLDREAAIEKDLMRSPNQAWAGDYYEGDGLGANIRMLVSAAGVAATLHGCMGLYGANEGSVVTGPDDRLRFTYSQPNDDTFGGFPNQVVPVRWGARHYLIDPDSGLTDFVIAINRGFEPRPIAHGRFLFAKGDELQPVDGPPQLPAKYAHAIKTMASTARVIGVQPQPALTRSKGPMCRMSYRLRLAISGAGPEPGDIYWLQHPDADTTMTLESVTPREVTGLAMVYEDECLRPKSVPDKSWVFTTGAYDPVEANRQIVEAGKEGRE